MKIIHLPTPVGGNAYGLSRAERLLGLESDVLLMEQNYFGYPADEVLFSKPIAGKMDKILSLPKKIKKINDLIRRYDVFHFNFGSSLIDHPNWGFPLWDLPYYQRAGKKIFVTYNGCDARQKYPNMQRTAIAPCFDKDCYSGMCNSGKLDRERQSKIRRFNQYADGIFALNPDLLFFLPERAQFLPYTIARWGKINILRYSSPSQPLHIVHAPTNQAVKGTKIILSALEQIEKKYPHKIRLTLVENMSHQEALNIYQTADLVIDQVLIGWYGAFAVEVMKMGKPVMVYIREEDLIHIPPTMKKDCLESFINVTPQTLCAKLSEIVENPSLLKNYHQAGLDYVHRWHDPAYVASLTEDAYSSKTL